MARSAQQKRLRIYKNFTETKQTSEEGEYKVLQVNSGDTLIVADKNGTERKVSLASIRAPKYGVFFFCLCFLLSVRVH
jgi:endonuclease YncB( thermonuclease family)